MQYKVEKKIEVFCHFDTEELFQIRSVYNILDTLNELVQAHSNNNITDFLFGRYDSILDALDDLYFRTDNFIDNLNDYLNE